MDVKVGLSGIASDQRVLPTSLAEEINHEFRTPLATLLGHLELLGDLLDESLDELPEDVVLSLRAMERAGQRLTDLVTSAADLAEARATRIVGLAG
jgi:signal transduction histidine kinase